MLRIDQAKVLSNHFRKTALYIGVLTAGTTSRMRAECLRSLRPDWRWVWIDTDVPMRASLRIWRSMAFRLRRGPVVERINATISQNLQGVESVLTWVDKGVYIDPEVLHRVRKLSGHLVHFTPDTAFYKNGSRFFREGLDLYDLVVSTKSFERELYKRHVESSKLYFTTQGYDVELHASQVPPVDKRREVVFIGLAEPDRERCLTCLLESGVRVRLAGRGWSRFLRKFSGCDLLKFEGEAVFGKDYSRLISGSWIGLGLLSKRFPERHTTRTFEIPACGTILASEKNEEICAFFREDEAILISSYVEMAEEIRRKLASSEESLKALAEAGRKRVVADGKDNLTILSGILAAAGC